MTRLAWIALGSNLGDRATILEGAIRALGDTPGIAVASRSSFHETAPVGGPSGQGAFLNAAVGLETSLGPLELLDRLRAIEAEAGRERVARWGSRTLDLDLLLYDDAWEARPRLALPHPRMAVRRFVLAPLAEIAPGVIHPPTGRTIRDLLANLDRAPRGLAIAGGEVGMREAIRAKAGEALGDGWRIDPSWPRGAAAAGDRLPIFVVDLDAPDRSAPSFPPRLEPEGSTADAIAAEVIATCRGIE